MEKKSSVIKKHGHIIKIDNSFNKTYAFNKLGAYEQNVAWAIISMFSTDDTAPTHSEVRQNLTIDSLEIRKLAGIDSKGSRVTIKEYRMLIEKLRKFFLTQFFVVHIKDGDDLVERGTPVFKFFDIRNDGEQVSIELMPEAAHFFSKIFDGLGFSIFALQKMVSIPSPTAKTLYRLFLDGRHIYGWNATYEELATLLGFSKKTAFYSFYRRLDKFISEIRDTGDFDRLEYTPIRDTTKRGHPIVSIMFDIKVKPDRVSKLVRHYHPQKKKRRPFFYALAIKKPSSSTTLLPDPNNFGTPLAIQNKKDKIVDVRCPKCGGIIHAFLKQNGKVAFVCDNSSFWEMGNQNCAFYAEEEQSERLTDDIKLWIDQMHKAVGENDLASCLKKLDTDNSSKESDNQDYITEMDEAPFPL